MASKRRPFQLGIEPRDIDLPPVRSRPWTPADQELLAPIMAKQRVLNDANPEILALRPRLTRVYSPGTPTL